MLKYGAGYVDQGETVYEERYRDRLLRNLKRRAANSASNSLRLVQALANRRLLESSGLELLGRFKALGAVLYGQRSPAPGNLDCPRKLSVPRRVQG